MALATVDVNFPVGTNIDLFDVGMLASGIVTAQATTSYTVVIGDESIAFSGVGFTYTGGIPSGGTITGMQDSYFGMPQITLQQLNVPVSALNAFIAAHDNAGAQAALFSGDDVITGGPLDDLFRGYEGADAIATGAGADTLDGGAGDDTVDGGAGGDVIATGEGADVIVVGQGQSAGQADVVSDWSSSDAIRFAHIAGDSSAYVEETAADFGAAAARADQLIGSGAANIVAIAVGGDVAVYADSGADNGVADDAVILSGRTLADVGYSNFGLAAASVTPPPSTSPGVELYGTSAADTLRGGAGEDTIDGGAGGDKIYTGDGADVVVVGQGQSLLDYGKTDSVMDWSSTDSIRFAHSPGAAGEYVEATANTWGAAATLANSLIGSGDANVVAVAIGGDVAVYADSAGDNGVADDLVVLSGRTLADISYANVQLSAPAGTPPVTVPPPAAPTGLQLDAASDSGVKGDGLTNLSQFRMTGVAEKGASVSLYDGNKLVGEGQADAATGAFSVAAATPLADGVHTLSAVATNSGGAGAYSASVQVTLDSVGPAAPSASLATDSATQGDGITNTGLVRMDGVAEQGAVVALYDGAKMIGTATASATTGAYSIQATTALADGVHVLQVQATDAAGNVGAMSGGSTVVVDSHAGVGAFDGFTETATGQRATVTLHGTAADEPAGVTSVNVFQDGSSIGSVEPVDGAWSMTKTNVSNAVHTYTLQITDAAGNVGAGTSSLILGSTNGDKIVGGTTNDIIHGDAGADVLTGGAGADVFVYNALDDAAFGKNKSSSVDTITDFQSGADRLDLSDLGHMTFKGQSPTVGAHEVSWYVSSGNTFVTGDVTGDGKADFIIQLKGALALSSSDFLLA
jgi:Ca2+-binding RTX toxin-like protein